MVRRIEKVTESNRKYKRVTVKTEKAEYGHVLTHAPSQRIREIHNRQALNLGATRSMMIKVPKWGITILSLDLIPDIVELPIVKAKMSNR